jgi:hypothetical protein
VLAALVCLNLQVVKALQDQTLFSQLSHLQAEVVEDQMEQDQVLMVDQVAVVEHQVQVVMVIPHQ